MTPTSIIGGVICIDRNSALEYETVGLGGLRATGDEFASEWLEPRAAPCKTNEIEAKSFCYRVEAKTTDIFVER